MATPEPFSAGWQARWHRAHGDARALPHWEAGLELWDTWRHRSPSLSGGVPGATGHVAIPEPSGTWSRFGAAGTRGYIGALPYGV
jgi:hypothetical protein